MKTICHWLDAISSFINNRKYLLWLILPIWICGIGLYFIGYKSDPYNIGGFPTLIRSLLSSTEMFTGRMNMFGIGKRMQQCSSFMICFSLTHLMATMASICVVFYVFFNRLSNLLKRRSIRDNKHEKHVFWGVNSNNLSLAKSLIQSKKSQSPDRDIIFFIDDDFEYEEENSSVSKVNIMKFISLSHIPSKVLETVQELGGLAIRYSGKSSIDKVLSMSHDSDEKVFFYFLSDSEDENIYDFNKISNHTLNRKHVVYYCHARKSVKNIAYQECHDNLILIDSAHLCFQSVRNSPKYHPINFVDLETTVDSCGVVRSTGIVTSKFTALIVGFGETGQDALSYLYEFSAFASKDGRRSPYAITAVDEKMDTISGTYYAEHPAISYNTNIYLHSAKIGSSAYWRIIKDCMREDLKYVVVSLGDDQLNISVAVDIYNEYLRSRSCNFLILVRQKNQDYQADINKLYPQISFIGTDQEIFNESSILGTEHQDKADLFKNRYELVSRQYPESEVFEPEVYREKTPLENLRSKHRKLSQNLANAYHLATKIQLLTNKGKDKDVLKHLNSLHRKPVISEFDGIYWYEDDKGKCALETTLITNVAICEHLRWIAAHEMMGYVRNDDDISMCNELEKKHNCMVEWEELDLIWRQLKDIKKYCEYKQYDYSIVETSIDLELGVE